MGLLSNEGPQPWHPAHPDTKAWCKKAGDYCKVSSSQFKSIKRLFIWVCLGKWFRFRTFGSLSRFNKTTRSSNESDWDE